MTRGRCFINRPGYPALQSPWFVGVSEGLTYF
eukprot:UN12436